MCTRGVWQLKKLTVEYCLHGGSSIGTRQFVRNSFANFAKDHPQTQFEAKLKFNTHPVVIAEYLNGNTVLWPLRKCTEKQVLDVVTRAQNRTGRTITKIKKYVFSSTPSIQGEWIAGATKKVNFEVKDM